MNTVEIVVRESSAGWSLEEIGEGARGEHDVVGAVLVCEDTACGEDIDERLTVWGAVVCSCRG